jgi:hypothetical protein
MNSQWQQQQPMPAVHNQMARHVAAISEILKQKPALSTGDSKLKPI